MAALDISFRNADGDEVEPDPAAGPVYVRLDARALIPDGVDESTVAVQHHAETTDGGPLRHRYLCRHRGGGGDRGRQQRRTPARLP